jgi:hypothetical protein
LWITGSFLTGGLTAFFFGGTILGGAGFGGAGGAVLAFGLGEESKATSMTLSGSGKVTGSVGCNSQTITDKCNNSTKIVNKPTIKRGFTSLVSTSIRGGFFCTIGIVMSLIY